MLYDQMKIANYLSQYSNIFYKLWDVGKPQFTDEIPTAAVSFDKYGNHINFLFNETFYNELSDYEKTFVISHEMMHIILNHGKRKKENLQLLNIAQDIAIHEIMFSRLKFKQEELKHKVFQSFCERTLVEKDLGISLDPLETAEYYYDKLLNSGKIKFVPLDTHYFNDASGLPDDQVGHINATVEISEEEAAEIQEKITGEKPCESKKAGDAAGGLSKVFKVKPKRKPIWERIIRDWVIKHSRFEPQEQWLYSNPRWNILDSVMLPYDKLMYAEDKGKKDIFLFQDTSGSCVNLAERFLKVARSIPEEIFNVRFFCFDTQVYEIDFHSGELKGFGGTRFDIIETAIQNIVKEEKRPYPQGVFIVTDGYGNEVSPQFPEKWHWLLSCQYNYYIHEKSTTYDLQDFE